SAIFVNQNFLLARPIFRSRKPATDVPRQRSKPARDNQPRRELQSLRASLFPATRSGRRGQPNRRHLSWPRRWLPPATSSSAYTPKTESSASTAPVKIRD